MIRFLLLALVAGHLLIACDAPPKGDGLSYPDAKSADFDLFARHCSQCHAPPQPTAHIKAEWPNVIARMQQHLVQRSMAPIPAADIVVLRRYLENHALEAGS